VIRLVRAEFVKLRTTQVWFWLLLAAVAISVLIVVAAIAPSDGVRTATDVPDIFASANSASIPVFVLGVLGVTTEFRYQTITPTVLITPSRWTLITAKMISYAILGALYALICLVLQLVIALPWLSSLGVHASLGDSDVQHAILAVFLIVALYGIIGLGIGALLKNQIVAVTVGVIFLLIIENIFLAIPGLKHAWPYMPNGASTAMLYTHGSTENDGVHLLGYGPAVVVLLLWAFVPAVIGAALTMNRDIT
jgi:ABC-2 type transport system permease protein